MDKNTIIDGIAASEHLDSSGESLSIEGMDISSLGGPDSILNWEHGSKERPAQVVGKVTFAKKIMKESDAANKREKYFWNKCKKPFVYIKAELFDGIGHSGAQDVAAMLKYKNKDKGDESRLVVGFSIEGGKIEKKGMVVTKSVARDVAITVKPCNKVCDAEVIKDEVKEDWLFKNQDFDCEILSFNDISINTKGYRDHILSDIKKSIMEGYKPQRQFSSQSAPDKMRVGDRINYRKEKPKTGQQIYKEPKTFDTDNNMRKTLVAGIMGGSPESLSGTAALTSENLEGKLEKPFKSKAQRRFAYANKEKFGGKEGIKEWEEKTSSKLPEKVKKSEKLEKMSQPVFSNRNIGSNIDLRSDVKTVDPEKTYTLKSGKTVTAPELETKKIQNKYVQGEKQVSGAKKLSDFTKKGRTELEEYKQQMFGSAVNPEKGQIGVNVQDPDYGVNEAYEFKQKQPKGAKPDISYPSTRHHEGTHKFFSSVAQKMGQDVTNTLIDHILNNFFDPKDLKSVNQNLLNYYDKNTPHLKEESLTHILDLIQDKKKRQHFHDNHSYMKSGELPPRQAEKMDRERMNRLKRGYQNAVKFINSLDKNSLSQFYKKRKDKKIST